MSIRRVGFGVLLVILLAKEAASQHPTVSTRVLLSPPGDTLIGVPKLIIRAGATGVMINPGVRGPIYYLADARPVPKAIGALGEGPGEYSRPAGLAVKGDTLVVWDVGTRRLTRFLVSGKPLGTRLIQPPREPKNCIPAGPTIDGDLVCLTGSRDSTRFLNLTSYVIPVWGGGRIRLASRGRSESSDLALTVQGHDFTSPRLVPVGPFFAGAHGLAKWAAIENTVDRGGLGHTRVTQGGADGVTRVWEVPFRPRPSMPLLDSLVSVRVRALQRRDPFRRLSESDLAGALTRASRPLPELVGGARSARVGADGCVWLRMPDEAAGAPARVVQRWIVLGSKTAPTGRGVTLDLPQASRVDDVSCTDAVGATSDSDGTPTIVRWIIPSR